MTDVDKDIFLIGCIVSTFIYYLSRHIINKKTNFDLPLLPERFHEDPLKTLVQALLTMFSIIVGMTITSITSKLLFGINM